MKTNFLNMRRIKLIFELFQIEPGFDNQKNKPGLI